jgi:nucleoside-diphosphate-sugar epimerase
MTHTIFIVGGAGYVGEMLAEQLGKRADVERIIILDKEPQSAYNKTLPKITYIEQNMADNRWQTEVAPYQPDTVIHTAWQIRALYGRADEQWRWNVEGSDAVFDFAFTTPSISKLIYFSTAASYSARRDNTLTDLFTEAAGFRPDEYIYAKEKYVTEQNLLSRFTLAQTAGTKTPQIFIVRPAAITGPRGRFIRIRFGLQSALSGNLPGGLLNKLVSSLTTFLPVTAGWVRQFIHEDDVTDIVSLFIFETFSHAYQVFNITPLGEPVLAPAMAGAVGKRILPIAPWMARLAFFIFWHATRGRVPTAPGAWRFYSYPIVMSGAKLATVYQCVYSSKDAITYTSGRYANWVPADKRRVKNAVE